MNVTIFTENIIIAGDLKVQSNFKSIEQYMRTTQDTLQNITLKNALIGNTKTGAITKCDEFTVNKTKIVGLGENINIVDLF